MTFPENTNPENTHSAKGLRQALRAASSEELFLELTRVKAMMRHPYCTTEQHREFSRQMVMIESEIDRRFRVELKSL